MTNNTLLTGFLFRQIFIVVFYMKGSSAADFMVGEKPSVVPDQQPTTEIKEAIHMI